MKSIAININLDSLGEGYGFPKDYNDPTFTTVMDRFFSLSEKWGFLYTIFVIGKDLEVQSNRRAVASWAKRGHEIGNHSWSHPHNFGTLSKEYLRQEILRSHNIIADCIGTAPKGFIAPGWGISRAMQDILMDLEYDYDTSSWPTILMYPALIKLLLNHRGDGRFGRVLLRKDIHYPLIGKRQAHCIRRGNKTLVSMPLPTNRFRIASWHTTAFMFGWNIHRKILRSSLRDTNYFYYLVHPADLAHAEDLDPSRKLCIERMNFPLDHKLRLMECAMEELATSGRALVTMGELAKQVLNS
jgi:hypothetical protein